MAKIKYSCKNCGWETSIREEWGDLKPKRCMNKRCNTSFINNPESLEVQRPEPQVSEPIKSIKNANKSKRQETSKIDE